MKPIQLFALLTVVTAAFAGGWFLGFANPTLFSISEKGQENVAETEPIHVMAQGRILPFGGIYNIVVPPGQRIDSVLVSEDQTVVAFETELAVLAGQNTLNLQSDLTTAQTENNNIELNQKILAARNSLLSLEGSIESAQLQLERTQAMQDDLGVSQKRLESAGQKLERLKKLADDPQTKVFVSQSQLTDQTLTFEQSQSQQISAAREQRLAVHAAELNLQLAQQSRDAAKQSLTSLEKLRDENRAAQLTEKLASTQRDNAKIFSPITGTVLNVFAKDGETVTNSPLMQIGNLTKMECVAEVVDRLVPQVKIGQRVTLSSPALSRELHGTVSQIGRMVGTGTLVNPSPLAMVDRRTVDVRMEIDASDVDLANKMINLQVTVSIDTPDSTNPTAGK